MNKIMTMKRKIKQEVKTSRIIVLWAVEGFPSVITVIPFGMFPDEKNLS